MKELRFLNKYFYKYRGRLLIGLVITAIATIFRIVVPSKIVFNLILRMKSLMKC